jgi:hypothetical protein
MSRNKGDFLIRMSLRWTAFVGRDFATRTAQEVLVLYFALENLDDAPLANAYWLLLEATEDRPDDDVAHPRMFLHVTPREAPDATVMPGSWVVLVDPNRGRQMSYFGAWCSIHDRIINALSEIKMRWEGETRSEVGSDWEDDCYQAICEALGD